MEVLVTTTPGTGHIHPVVPLAVALRDAGHHVRWATGPASHGTVARFGFPVVAAGLDTPRRIALVAEQHPELLSLPPRARRAAAFRAHFAAVAAPSMAADLRPLVEQHQPDLIVHDLAELASVPLAHAAGIPHVTVAFGGGLPRGAIEAAAGAVAPVWAGCGLDVPDDLGLYDDLYLHPFPASLGQVPSAPSVRPIRPGLVDGGEHVEPPAWLDRLGRDRAAVWVTFGTEMGPLAPWPALLEGVSQIDVDAVVTVGALDPRTLPAAPDNVRVERYVPQRFLLDRVAAVVCHGGAGTVLGSAARGIPQLVVPVGADQWENGDALAGAGAGAVLEVDRRTPPGVAQALAAILADADVKAAADRLAAELSAMLPAESLVAEIEALAAGRRTPGPAPTPGSRGPG